MGWALRKRGKTPIVLVVCDNGLVLLRDGRGWTGNEYTSFEHADNAVIEGIARWNKQSYSEGQPATVEIPGSILLEDHYEATNEYFAPLLKELGV